MPHIPASACFRPAEPARSGANLKTRLAAAGLFAMASASFPQPGFAAVVTEAGPATPGHALLQAQRTLRFEKNLGQTDERVRFYARGQGYTLFLTAEAAVFALRPAPANAAEPGRALPHQDQSAVLRMRPVAANPAPPMAGLDRLPGSSNYFKGSDPTRWRTGVPSYAQVKAQAVYPGIDLVYYGRQQQLEFDFVVAPGADPAAIRLAFDGADAVTIGDDGDLVLAAGDAVVRLRKPFIYQEAEDGRQAIAGAFVLTGETEVGFRIAAYDTARALEIDPVLVYSTYLGGSGEKEYLGGFGAGIAVDAEGKVYVVGTSGSIDFPVTAGAWDETYGATGDCVTSPASPDTGDAFVVKIDPYFTSPASLVYATYLGGTCPEFGIDIAVDPDGHAYITGFTYSEDDLATTVVDEGFPTTPGAFQELNRSNTFAGFVTKLDKQGSAIVYSTHIGIDLDPTSIYASGFVTRGIAVDAEGHAYVAGKTGSTIFPTTVGAYFRTRIPKGQILCDVCGSGTTVTKFNPEGTGLVYSTYLGEHGGEPFAIAVDNIGRAYVTGEARSSDGVPIYRAYQSSGVGRNAFLTVLNADGAGIVYSTLLGGSNEDVAYDVAVDRRGHVYITGKAFSSSDFPLRNAFQSNAGNGFDTFVAKFDPALAGDASLVYSTFLGGNRDDLGTGIAVDWLGRATVTGWTNSTDFPLKDPIQDSYGGGTCPGRPCGDVFLTRLSPGGNELVQSTYLGGNGNDRGLDVEVDNYGAAYLVGVTGSVLFPTTIGAWDRTCGTDDMCNPAIGVRYPDAFVTKFSPFVPGIVATWGENFYGTLGDGTTLSSRPVADLLPGFTDVVALSGGPGHTLALRLEGRVWAWGSNAHGQLGTEPADGNDVRPTPLVVAGLDRVVAIAANGVEEAGHSLAIRQDGTLWAWGANGNGQLGDGTTEDRSAPVRVVGLDDVVAVAAGEDHSLAVRADGSVWAWGRNHLGQLGNGSLDDSPVPVPVSGLGGLKSVAASTYFSMALGQDGTVWTWGHNTRGRLGDGVLVTAPPFGTPVPVQVVDVGSNGSQAPLPDVVEIAAGLGHNLALKADGAVLAWGSNQRGALGVPVASVPDMRAAPVQVLDPDDPSGVLRDVQAIAAGRDSGFAIKQDGTLRAWGHNGFGQLGDGTTAGGSDLRRSSALNQVVAVEMGDLHSQAIVAAPARANGATVGGEGGIVATGAFPDDTLGAALYIAPNALAADTEITVTELDPSDPGLPAPPANSLSRVFEFAPAGLTFAAPVTIVFTYDDAEVAGRDETQLQVNLFLSGGYLAVADCIATDPPSPDPCVEQRDPTTNTVTVVTKHFTRYALSAP